MRRLLRIGIVTAAVGLIVAGTAAPCFACSCAFVPPRRALQGAEAAFVGTLVSREEPAAEDGLINTGQQVDWTFDVDEALVGSLADPLVVRSAWSGASCGIEVREGQQVGLILFEEEGVWSSGLCSQYGANELSRAAADLGVSGTIAGGAGPLSTDGGAPKAVAIPEAAGGNVWPWLAAGGALVVVLFVLGNRGTRAGAG